MLFLLETTFSFEIMEFRNIYWPIKAIYITNNHQVCFEPTHMSHRKKLKYLFSQDTQIPKYCDLFVTTVLYQ